MVDDTRNPDGTMRRGHSANPNGRPRGSKNLMTIFNEKRDEKISLKVEGRVVKMSRLEAWLTNMWNRAIELDAKASAQILAILRASGQADAPVDATPTLDRASIETLEALLGRIAEPEQVSAHA